MAFHPLGTARADARASHGVTDGDLAVHGVEGLYIADGSVVPSALGVNPQLTIMALATRLADHLLDREPPGAASPRRERRNGSAQANGNPLTQEFACPS